MKPEELIKKIEEHTSLTYTWYSGDEDEEGEEVSEERIKDLPTLIKDLETQRDKYKSNKETLMDMIKNGELNGTLYVVPSGSEVKILTSRLENVTFVNDGQLSISNCTFTKKEEKK